LTFKPGLVPGFLFGSHHASCNPGLRFVRDDAVGVSKIQHLWARS
jgi:hypothetical protein